MSEARQALLDKTIAHVAAHGLSDLSLRELAAAVGTSHRMLIYHFGSREGLVAAIVESMEAQQRTPSMRWPRRATRPALIEPQWAQLTDPAPATVRRPLLRGAGPGAAPPARHRGVRRSAHRPVDRVGDRPGRRLDLATDVDELRLGVAVSRGLLVEVLATGDVEGPTAVAAPLPRHVGGRSRLRPLTPNGGGSCIPDDTIHRQWERAERLPDRK